MEKEYLTIAEFSQLAGISKQAIYKRLSADLLPYVKVIDGKKHVEKRALNLFNQQLKVETTVEQPVETELKQEPKERNQEIEFLKQQIKEKDLIIANQQEEIKRLNNHIFQQSEKLMEVLQQQTKQQENFQILLAQQTKEIQALSGSTVEQPVEKKKSFWQRIRKK